MKVGCTCKALIALILLSSSGIVAANRHVYLTATPSFNFWSSSQVIPHSGARRIGGVYHRSDDITPLDNSFSLTNMCSSCPHIRYPSRWQNEGGHQSHWSPIWFSLHRKATWKVEEYQQCVPTRGTKWMASAILLEDSRKNCSEAIFVHFNSHSIPLPVLWNFSHNEPNSLVIRIW